MGISPHAQPKRRRGMEHAALLLRARGHTCTGKDSCNGIKNKLARGELGVIDNQLVTMSWVGPVLIEFLNFFFLNRKEKLLSIFFAKQFN